jgi:Alpha/beta hydrolase domain
MATFARPRPVSVTIDDARRVSALLQAPKNARICYVLAHSAGAGMLQGRRDALADVHPMEKLAQKLGSRATLKLFSHADHSFHVPPRSGRKDAEIRTEVFDALAAWIETVV